MEIHETHRRRRLRRDLHPGAWWGWALLLAAAATRTTNPLLLAAMVAVIGVVVSARRTDAPWAKGFGAYLVVGLVAIAIRLVFRMLLDGGYGAHVLFHLPELRLPDAAAGIRLGGPVTLEGMTAALYNGMQLATMLICVGAANVLANPKRLLRALPSALWEVGAAITVALSVAPQLVESGRRIARAQALRSGTRRRMRWFRQLAVPVMTDALDRSIALAAAMDVRGYGRTSTVTRASRRVTGALVLGGLFGICVGSYGLLDPQLSDSVGVPMLLGGAALCGLGMRASGSKLRRTRYRPDRWGAAEWGVVACGAATLATLTFGAGVNELHPPFAPVTWPTLPIMPFVGVIAAGGAAVVSPPPALDVGTTTGAAAGTTAPTARVPGGAESVPTAVAIESLRPRRVA